MDLKAKSLKTENAREPFEKISKAQFELKLCGIGAGKKNLYQGNIMKLLFFASALVVSSSVFAAWTESVDCVVSRGNVDTGAVTRSAMAGELRMAGPHNGEAGKVSLRSDLIPSYAIVFEKVSGGRTDESTLTSSLGRQIVAKSSIDDQQSDAVENKFVTSNGDFQISISCSSKP